MLGIALCLMILSGCKRELTEEQKKKDMEIRARHSENYKPSDGAFGAKDYATESKEASEQDTQQTEEQAQEANQ